MDKKTILRYILAIVLSAILFGVVFILQNPFWAPKQKAQEPIKTESTNQTQTGETKGTAATSTETQAAKPLGIVPVEDKSLSESDIAVQTAVYNATFSTKGGVIKSIKLKNYKESSGAEIEFIVS